MGWFGFWMFMTVFVVVDAWLYSKRHDGWFFTHKTEAEKGLQRQIIDRGEVTDLTSKEKFWKQWDVAGKPGAVIRVVEAAWDAQQARIDALMLEYCPDEMTPEQVAEWERHQKVVSAGCYDCFIGAACVHTMKVPNGT